MTSLTDEQADVIGEYIETILIEWFDKDPNITSIGIARRILEKEGDRETDEIVISFTVKEKKSLEEIPLHLVVPGLIAIRDMELGTDVVGRVYSHHLRKKNLLEEAGAIIPGSAPVIVPGISVGNVYERRTGTISAIVYKDGTTCILSNHHILGNDNTDVCQPGFKDNSNTANNKIGVVLASSEEFDCAVAAIDAHRRNHDRRMGNLNNLIIDTPAVARLDQRVVKLGRGTGVTHGIVKEIRRVIMSEGVELKGQFVIKTDPRFPPSKCEMTAAMDSGAPWILKGSDNRPTSNLVGINVGGNRDGGNDCRREYAHGTEIRRVIRALGITLAP